MLDPPALVDLSFPHDEKYNANDHNSDFTPFSSRVYRGQWAVYPHKPKCQEDWDKNVRLASVAAAEVTAASDKVMPPEKCKVKGLKCVKFLAF